LCGAALVRRHGAFRLVRLRHEAPALDTLA
jgi:hypothetical protein